MNGLDRTVRKNPQLFARGGTGGYVVVDYMDGSRPQFADGLHRAGLENLRGGMMIDPDGVSARRPEWLPRCP